MSISKSKAAKIIKEVFDKEIYSDSLQQIANVWLALTKSDKGNKKLICIQLQPSELFEQLEAQVEKQFETLSCKLCALTEANAKSIRQHVAWAAPTPVGSKAALLGMGDRLGIATPAHILTAKKTKVSPVLAQASKDTLKINGFNFAQVLDNATWGVLQSGWQNGWSANAEQLSTEQDIAEVLQLGYTGLTLDCSAKVQNVDDLNIQQLDERYAQLPTNWRQELENNYLNRIFEIQEYGTIRLPLCASGGNLRYKAGKFRISYSLEQLKLLAVTYFEMLSFATDIYDRYIRGLSAFDFTPALNRGQLVTTPQAHLFIANELNKREIVFSGLAPRFVGEFPGGIDYAGDKWAFEQTFSIHAAIADHYGHRLDFPYSDKYSLYPFIGRDTRGRIAIKTEGTSWLEAVHTIWKANPELFKDILNFTRKHLAHIKTQAPNLTLEHLQPIDSYSHKELEKLVVCDDACRQALHLACELLLKDQKLRPAIYNCLQANESLHYKVVSENLNKHIEYLRTIKRSLGLPKNRLFKTE